jgi:serine/threonine protein kinase/sugar lactone lactonase YvrE
MPLAPGTRVGSYEIVSSVGAGGMGEVYRARDSKLKRDVAIKVLPADVASNRERLARFEREAHVLASLNHPHIASIYGLEENSGVPALVMELVEGDTLAELIKRGPIPVDEALNLARQIAEALEYAHEHGVVHRDLKPANVIVSREGAVKVLDFGLAKAITGEGGDSSSSDATHSPTLTSPATRAGIILGTAAYMAPEQARGKSVDRRADVWAFGVVLYEMLTGGRLFAGETVSDTIAAILTQTPAFERLPATTPSSVRRLLERCLDRDPKQRLRDIGEARIALERIASGDRDETPVLPSASKRGAGSRIPWLIAGVAVAAAIASVIVTNSRRAPVVAPVNFVQKTFRDQTIYNALFAPDGQTIVFSSARTGNTPYLYSLRPEYAEPMQIADEPLQLLSISSTGEMAVLTRPQWFSHRLCQGTLARMPLGGGAPREIMDNVHQAAWSPDGKELAIIHEAGGMHRLEFPPGKVLFETAGYVSDLRFSPNGDRIAYFEHPAKWDDRGLIAVVDLEGKRTVLSDGYWGEEGIAWSREGDIVYFSAGTGYADFSVYAVDLKGNVHVALQSAGGLIIHDIAADGTWMATRDDLTRGMRARAPGQDTERDLSWRDFCAVIDLSDDGRTLLFCSMGVAAGLNYLACLRNTDGSPVVVLGEGSPMSLSPDGRWTAAIIYPDRLLIYPNGAGSMRELERGPISSYLDAEWFRDGQRLLITAAEPGSAGRCYVQDFAGGLPRPLMMEDTRTGCPAPDGTHALVQRGDLTWWLVAIEGDAKPVPAKGLAANDTVDGWSLDGRSVIVFDSSRIPTHAERVDLETGTRTVILRIEQSLDAGVQSLGGLCFDAKQESYAYDLRRYVSHLYHVTGAR